MVRGLGEVEGWPEGGWEEDHQCCHEEGSMDQGERFEIQHHDYSLVTFCFIVYIYTMCVDSFTQNTFSIMFTYQANNFQSYANHLVGA